ncbi:hypothetical protein KIL84_008400 [Mauremys mutica]|uniref:Uncharacterized protein n=1 Tax=Mauremys mutica TaxID=74926 RepID=A0A9D3X9M8_9SAUR|nr:hypothetical protein KIL84_008400 [Mauremys mutica]
MLSKCEVVQSPALFLHQDNFPAGRGLNQRKKAEVLCTKLSRWFWVSSSRVRYNVLFFYFFYYISLDYTFYLYALMLQLSIQGLLPVVTAGSSHDIEFIFMSTSVTGWCMIRYILSRDCIMSLKREWD